MLRLIRWSASFLVVLAAVGWGSIWLAQDRPQSRAAALVRRTAAWLDGATPAAPAGERAPFSLVDQNDHRVTDVTYRGKWMLVYFGYTYCPDLCPTMLQTISSTLDSLGDKAVQVAPLFITIDPHRDTPAAIGQYVALFDSRLIGLTGTAAQVTAAEAAYHVYSKPIGSTGDGGYVIDHSSYAYLMDPDGKLNAVFQGSASEDVITAAIVASMAARKL